MKSIEMTAWGKFEDNIAAHHLAHHCADVAACFLALAALPVWQDRMERAAEKQIDDCQMKRLAVLVFLHDIGKLYPGFQCKVWGEDVKAALGTESRRCHGTIGHSQAGVELLLTGEPRNAIRDIRDALYAKEIYNWSDDPETILNLLLASFAHHGRPISGKPRAGSEVASSYHPLGAYTPLSHAQAIGMLIKSWFPTAFDAGASDVDLPGNPDFLHLYAGMVSLADWIGSDKTFFKFVAEPDEGYFAKAQQRAHKALKAVGLDVTDQYRSHKAPVSFKQLTDHNDPNPQQAAMSEENDPTEENDPSEDKVPLDTQFVILEAETGSGKTEAALWRFIKLYEAGKVDGLYFAVPTRTAALQLHNRIHKAVKRVFGEAEAPQTVLAVPGYYKAGDHTGRPLPNWQVLWDDDDIADNEQLARRWAAEHTKRYLASQIAVGTIDQAMLGVLMTKHAHLRASSLARSLLVIDEVHASDIFMSRIQQRLVNDHVRIGGHVLAMSATLGASARREWLGMPEKHPFKEDVKTGYPAIWLQGKADPILPGKSAEADPQKTVHMASLKTMAADSVAKDAIKAARNGAKVLVVRNTVQEACKAFSAIESSLGDEEKHLLFAVNGIPALHHSRFAAEDRALLDQKVEALLGKDGARPADGLIVVGTQTLEQSLDICADYLITDLCPIDVLLQRIGRLHRHKNNPRPAGYEQPQCKVLLPDEGLEKCLTGMVNGLGGWTGHDGCLAGIYLDVAGLELTRRIIEDKPEWRIPAMNRELVESGTHPDRIKALTNELGSQWQNYYSKLFGNKLADGMSAKLMMFNREEDFEELAFPDDEKIRTRLSEDGCQLEFAEPFTGPFGEKVSKLTLPSHWSRGMEMDAEPVVHRRETGEVGITVVNRGFTYNYMGLTVDKQYST